MKLLKVKLGDYIELTDNRNNNNQYVESDVKGISTLKVFIETKANLNGVSLSNYKIVNIDEFAYVADTSRRGDKIGLAYAEKNPCIISSIYTTFRVKDNNKLLPRYLMMFFNRLEFDRYARFNSWGSARETFSWEDFCDIELVIPSIEIQKKYVAIYESMLKNLHSYEKGLDDLKLVCDGYIEKLRDKEPVKLEGYIHEISNKNEDGRAKLEMGVSINKEFILTKAKSSNIENQKVVATGQFAYNSNTSRNSDTISLALNISNDNYAVSNTYITFECDERLNPKYLYLWFKRKEFDRFARFNSWGSARETIGIDELSQSKIAIPEMMIQNNIVKILKIYNYRKSVVEKMKLKIKNICPILIRGSIKECEKGA